MRLRYFYIWLNFKFERSFLKYKADAWELNNNLEKIRADLEHGHSLEYQFKHP